jgi:hypothetical protein
LKKERRRERNSGHEDDVVEMTWRKWRGGGNDVAVETAWWLE